MDRPQEGRVMRLHVKNLENIIIYVTVMFFGNYNYYSLFDDVNGLYDRSGVTLELDDPALVSYAPPFTSVDAWNNTFDSVVDAGGIYTMYFHPPGIVHENLESHLNHVAGRTDVWYTGYGHAYLYQYTRNLVSLRIPANGQVLYVYYGNQDAESSSNYDNTFSKIPTTQRVVGFWNMDEANETTLHDLIGNENGIINGAAHIRTPTANGHQTQYFHLMGLTTTLISEIISNPNSPPNLRSAQL